MEAAIPFRRRRALPLWTSHASLKFSTPRSNHRKDKGMSDQHQRLLLENQVLHKEGFTQFSIYQDNATGQYYVAGYTNSSSGRSYRLYISIPAGYPQQRPAMYITDPNPLRMKDGSLITALGIS